MAAKGQVGRYPVRLTVFVTQEMDDHLDDMAELMQVTKQEYIRHILGTSRASMESAVKVIKERANTEDFSKLKE